MRTFTATIVGLLLSLTLSPAFAEAGATGGPTASPPGASAYFVDLKDGATIGPTTTIHFGLHGMGVAPAGSDKANSGHHHLLIDTDLPPLDQPIPNDENHIHFGAGQTEVDLTLTPGPHTLQLLLGDKDHIPHSPPVMSPLIHVNVAAAGDALAARRRGLFRRPERWRDDRADHDHPFRAAWDGRGARRFRQSEFRPSSSSDRHGSASARSADPER